MAKILVVFVLLLLGAVATDLMRQRGWLDGGAVWLGVGWAGFCGVLIGRMLKHRER